MKQNLIIFISKETGFVSLVKAVFFFLNLRNYYHLIFRSLQILPIVSSYILQQKDSAEDHT